MARGGARPGAGKPKGTLASHTLEAQELKKALILGYKEKAKEINSALFAKALDGDVPAIKEVYDRVYGKSVNPIELSGAVDIRDLTKEEKGKLNKLLGE